MVSPIGLRKYVIQAYTYASSLPPREVTQSDTFLKTCLTFLELEGHLQAEGEYTYSWFFGFFFLSFF